MSELETRNKKLETAQTITQLVHGTLTGPGDLLVTGVRALDRAGPDHVSFVGDKRYADRWARSRCRVVLVTRGLELPPRDEPVAVIRVDHADLAMTAVLERFAPPIDRPPAGVHPSAVVDPSAKLGEGVRVGPLCVVGPRARIGDRCTLHAHVTVAADAMLGDDCELFPGVVIGQRCTLDDRCIVHPNAVIGADGFGYRADPRKQVPVKVPQIGTVTIGSDVEIGAGTCIDRAKFDATVIGDHCKIDNLVQIGHNCTIGRGVIIAGLCGVAGSVTIEDGVVMGGGAIVKDHLTLGRGAQIAGGTQLMHDVPAGETWAGSPGQPIKAAARQELALRKLPDLLKQMKRG